MGCEVSIPEHCISIYVVAATSDISFSTRANQLVDRSRYFTPETDTP